YDFHENLAYVNANGLDFSEKLFFFNWPLSYERGDLEGTYLHIKRIERRIALIAKCVSVAKSKAKLLISQINEAVKDCRERKTLSMSKEFDSEIDKWGEISESNFYDVVFPWETDGIVRGRYFLLSRELANLKEKITKSVFCFKNLEDDDHTNSSSSSSDEDENQQDSPADKE
ncbi:Uncharacterized protein APZ42_026176, partial [Daphnia magna]